MVGTVARKYMQRPAVMLFPLNFREVIPRTA